jgi:hypothetical protein
MSSSLLRLMRLFPALAVLFLAGTGTAAACNVCYGEAEGPMIEAASMGVWLLIAVLAAVQSSFALFFIYLWRRARKFAAHASL